MTKGVYRDTTGAVLGIYGISHDITELRKAQDSLEQTRAALFRSQKMEAVGQLTGGIAHDFNNILMVILGNLELLKLRLPEGDDHAVELIDETLRATRHGQDLTGDLLAFSRRRQLNPQPVGINALVENIVRLLGRTLGATIRITTATSRDAGVALVDPAALEAAILNIALNARDAMPDGGTLTIRTSKADITQAPRTEDDLPIGQYAMVAIQDTGTGMPPEVVARVFEPFFTTKTGGGGSGLGLSMVYGFAKQSGGTVTIASEAGRGTTVIIYLPLTRSEPRAAAAPALPIMPPVVSRTILVVEDEAAVRSHRAAPARNAGPQGGGGRHGGDGAADPARPGAAGGVVDGCRAGRGHERHRPGRCRPHGAARPAGDPDVGLYRRARSAGAHPRARRAAAVEAVNAVAARTRAARRVSRPGSA